MMVKETWRVESAGSGSKERPNARRVVDRLGGVAACCVGETRPVRVLSGEQVLASWTWLGRAMANLYGSAEARALHAEVPPIDLHADPLLWARLVGYDLNREHKPPLPQARFGGHVDVPRLRQGGVGAQMFGLVSLPVLDRDWEAVCHRQIDLLEQAIAASSGQLQLARSAAEVETIAASGGIAALLCIEGAHALRGDLAALQRFAARGVRALGLLHFSANECGAPSAGWRSDERVGLTPFGVDVVQRCEELGVLVDLAHINKKGFMEACALATKPLLVSHTGISGVHSLWRNVDDEQLRAVATKGGAVGVIFCPYYLGKDGIDAVVDHLEHVVRVAGEDTPALGSDWDGFIRPTVGLEEASKLPQLTDAMLRRRMPRRVIEKILRHNAQRVFREAMG